MLSLIPVIPLLHTGGPAPGGPTYSHWVLEPSIAAYVFGITAIYLLWVGPLNRRRPGFEERPVTPGDIRWFLVGSVFALISLGPPLDDWSDFYFLSAHMLEHLLLMFVVAPCWLAGIPGWVYKPIFTHGWSRTTIGWLLKPVPALIVSSAIMAIWHFPIAYDAALRHNWVHVTQHQFFLVSGLLLWWPLMSRSADSPPLSPPGKCLYLFLLTLPSGLIGAFITYASPGIYAPYKNAAVRPWGFSLKADQQLAGLMMWVGMNAIFLVLLTVIFLRWANSQERDDREALRAEAQARRARNAAAATASAVPGSPSAPVVDG